MISRVNELIHFTKLDLPRPLTIGHETRTIGSARAFAVVFDRAPD